MPLQVGPKCQFLKADDTRIYNQVMFWMKVLQNLRVPIAKRSLQLGRDNKTDMLPSPTEENRSMLRYSGGKTDKILTCLSFDIRCILGWVGLGRGGDNTKPASCSATWSSLALGATLIHDFHLHLTLRYVIFTCTWCYAGWVEGLGGWGGDSTKPASCYTTWSSLALEATIHDLHLHVMLRYIACTWRYTTWSWLAFDATLLDLDLHLTLHYMVCTCVWCYATRPALALTWCYTAWSALALDATWSSLALDATLHDLDLHLTLRYVIFTWCHAMLHDTAWGPKLLSHKRRREGQNMLADKGVQKTQEKRIFCKTIHNFVLFFETKSYFCWQAQGILLHWKTFGFGYQHHCLDLLHQKMKNHQANSSEKFWSLHWHQSRQLKMKPTKLALPLLQLYQTLTQKTPGALY